MAESFVERMRYLLSELSLMVEGSGLGLESAMIEKVAVILEKFESTLGDELHRIRMLEDKSEALSWMDELEEATYKMEDAVGKWRVKFAESAAGMERVRFTVLWAGCYFPRCYWAYASVKASMESTALASAMATQVETLLLKGKKLVDKTKMKTSPEEEDDQGLVSSVREDDMVSVLGHLLSPDPEAGRQVVSIVGFGGIGKTTLARSLFNHDSVKAYFQVRVWVHASTVLDERWIATMLLDSLYIQYEEEEESGLESLIHLIHSSFSGKSVLAVFDDVWDGSKSWEPFIGKLFEKSEAGSRILVTTRSGRACAVGILHTLAPLSVEECKLIMKTVANVDIASKSIEIKLAKRCEGSPLVAKILGIQLRSKSSFIESVLNQYNGEVCMMRFPHFYHTYENLLPHMKACLLCCANFPKSAILHSEKIIILWMSQGYLGYHSTAALGFNCSYRLSPYPDGERKGIECISRLIDLSFFQRISSQSIHKPSSDISLMCKMPDDVHDFVTYMAQAHANGQRSFSSSVDQIPVEPGLFRRIQFTTTLVLSSCQLDQLPDEVSLLSRLQYLDLSDNPLKRLPSTICELHYLEFQDVHCCYTLSCLPEKIGMLKELRHLRIKHTTEELHDLPSGFEDLTLMRTMDVFRIGGKYKDAINKLSNLYHLVDICIAVHGEVHLPAANLGLKFVMVNLELIFVGEGRNQEIVSSIEDLELPPNLEMLKFEYYPGLKLPSWILAEYSIINKLKRLSLRSAANLSSLPSLWKLSSLEFLWLYDIPNLKHLGCDFFGLTDTPEASSLLMSDDYSSSEDSDMEITSKHPVQDAERDLSMEINDHTEANYGEITVEDPVQDAEREGATAFRRLKTLRIEYLENWETWEDANEGDEFNIKVMPCLEELFIAHCPKLHGRPLYILRDTRWFNDSYPMEVKNKGEAIEKNVMLPSQEECSSSGAQADNINYKGTNIVALKASYIKLKKFVRDAYITKGPSQSLKVSIQEGVLGKATATSYLPLDSLHDWFEEDRSIFAEQMCVWSKHIYELMTPSDKDRVQMVSSALIKTVGRQEHSDMRAEDLADFMTENKAHIYLVPFLSPVERKYITRNLNSTLAHDSSWKVVDIKHKRQVYKWECGYYVMIWMQNIALEIQDLSLEPHFPTDESPYKSDKLREVDWKWCSHVIPEFLA